MARVVVASSTLAALLVSIGCASVPTSDAGEAHGAPAPRFYHGLSYGSEEELNPLSEIANEGFDYTQTNGQDRHLFHRNLSVGVRNVWASVTHPDATFRFYGYHRALVNEWLPLSLANDHGGGAWVPNYEYHLVGSGMVSVRMEEWFEAHGMAHPALLSALTMMTAHYLNETIENGASRQPNEDATTDLLLFDAGGLLLWRLDPVQRLFSGPLQLTNWPAQPSVDVPSGTIENAAQQFVLRVRLPRTERWRLFYDFGMSTLGGLSYGGASGDALSLGAGVDAVDNPVVDSRTGARGATLRFKGGVFYDRRGSLLASVQLGSRLDDAPLDVNVYPGAFGGWREMPGLWLQRPRAGGLRIGVASRWGLGLGHGPER